MKKLIALVLCLMMLSGVTMAFAEGWFMETTPTDTFTAVKYVETTGNVNIRKGPGLDYDTLGSVSAGNFLEYLNETSVDGRGVTWFKVIYKNSTGWISSKYAKLDGWQDTVRTYVQATGGLVSVRTGPAVSYEGVGTLEKGERVLYLNEVAYDANGNAWYKVQYYDYFQGWVSSTYSKLVQDTSAGVPASTGASVTGSYVKATDGNSNLRSEPNLNGKDLGTIHEGETATYLGQSSVDQRGVTWYKVQFEGKTGWVSSRYTKLY